MTLDDDGDDGGLGPPLPPDDRLWRHPSELGGLPRADSSSRGGRAGRTPVAWNLVVLAGLAGAVMAAGTLAATGSLGSRVVTRRVVEKVAVTPVVSSPVLPGDSGERGVAAVAERLGPAIVHLDVERGGEESMGSGVLYRDDGLLLTTAHLVADASSITAVLADGRRVGGRLVGHDPVTDVALVDLDGEGYPVAVLGADRPLEVGAPVIAIGSPQAFDGAPTVTTGVISALDQRVRGVRDETLHGMIEVDIPLTMAWSGGALVDAYGAVIGIATAVDDDAGDRAGFATPVVLAHRVSEALQRDGHMIHTWLGVEGADLTPKQAKLLQVSGGALVRAVAPGSPAAGAGLQAEDVITEVDGTPITSISALVRVLRSHDLGSLVRVGYWRAGEHATVEVTLAPRPS